MQTPCRGARSAAGQPGSSSLTLVQVFEQNIKKLRVTVWVEQNKQTKRETALSHDFWCCNVLVRNTPSKTGDLSCKGTKNQVRLSHWEVYLFRRQRSSTGPGAVGDSGLDGLSPPCFPPSSPCRQVERAAAKLTTPLQ